MDLRLLHLVDTKGQPAGRLLETAGGHRVACEVCGWSTEADGRSAGAHIDELLPHLAEH